MPAATTSVLYPQGAKFDLDYYLKTHMPLAWKTWSPHGLKGWKVAQYPEDQPYAVHAILEWESVEASQKALQHPDTQQVFGDVKNFTDAQPVLLSGAVVGTS